MRKSEAVSRWADKANAEHRLTSEHRVDEFKRLVDFLANFGSSQDDLTADEDEKDDLGLHHTIDKTREQFRFVRAEVVMATRKTFKTDGKLDVARPDNVLDLEIGELRIEAEFLDNPSVLPRRQLRVIFRLCAGDDHLARGEDQSGSLGFTDAHDHSSETLDRPI